LLVVRVLAVETPKFRVPFEIFDQHLDGSAVAVIDHLSRGSITAVGRFCLPAAVGELEGDLGILAAEPLSAAADFAAARADSWSAKVSDQTSQRR